MEIMRVKTKTYKNRYVTSHEGFIMDDINLYLQSRQGSIKTIKEWQEECTAFYKELSKEEVSNQWERFTRIIGLQQAGDNREWDSRKPVRSRKEGLTGIYDYDY